MNTKLDFKIETDKYEVIGAGPMIYTPTQVGDWWVTPAQDYKGKVPPEIQQKMFEFLNKGGKAQGFLIAEDIRDVKKEPEKRPDKPNNGEWLGGLFGILAGIAMVAIHLASAMCSFDPMLIAVLPDGRWICLGSWYD